MKKLILILIITSSAFTTCFSQILNPVKWQFGSKKLNDKEAVIFMKATIEEGWHIYSLHVPEGGPIKTSFVFEPDDAYSLEGKTLEPKPKSKYEKVFDLDVPYFENEVVFQQRIKLNKAGGIKINGVVEFMSCDVERCLPQDEMGFTVVIN